MITGTEEMIRNTGPSPDANHILKLRHAHDLDPKPDKCEEEPFFEQLLVRHVKKRRMFFGGFLHMNEKRVRAQASGKITFSSADLSG